MPRNFCCNKIAYVVVVITFVITRGYCDAFTARQEFVVDNRQSLSPTNNAAKLCTLSLRIRFLQPRYTSVFRMTLPSANDNIENVTENVATMLVNDEYDTDESPLPSEDVDIEVLNPPFDKIVWNSYEATMEKIMKEKRVVKKLDDEVVSKCRAFLLSNELHLFPVPDIVRAIKTDNNDKKAILESSLSDQARIFQLHYNFTQAEIDLITRCLVYIGDSCAKTQSQKIRSDEKDGDSTICDGVDPQLAITVSWHKLKEMGFVIRENSMSTYMYILGSSGKGHGEHDALVDDALLEVVTCHDTIYKPNEKTLTIRLKSLISRGKIDEAEDMFASSFGVSGIVNSSQHDKKESTEGRLRTFMPLMEHYCKGGNLASTLRLYRHMQDCPGVHWDVESYSLLLSSLAKFGYFFGDDDHSLNTKNGTDCELYGPILFDTLTSNMADDILELTEETYTEMKAAFQIGIRDHLGKNIAIDYNVEDKATLSKGIFVDRVKIPKGNGTCPVTGVKLRLFALDKMQRQHVHDTLLEMSRTTSEEFVATLRARQKGSKKNGKRTRVKSSESVEDSRMKTESFGYQELLKFSKWLDNREGKLFTTIVDGANVAYHGSNTVHYSSLQKVVEKLVRMGERPLVVMPEKYTRKSFACRPNLHQKLTRKALRVIDWLREKEMMYIVPRLSLDDYFWMLASVSNQTNASQRDDLSIPIGDDKGRFPGMRPMLITNDQMRDHKLDLLQPREFRRWTSCHIVNYAIGPYEEDEWEEERKISFVAADCFSREIQANLHENGKDNVWHFPIGDSTDWLCIWINQ